MKRKATSVIATGTIEQDPVPFLTPDRKLACRLSVSIRRMYLIEEGEHVFEPELYTVEVFSSTVWTLFQCATPSIPVVIVGSAYRNCHYIRADRVFRRSMSTFQ